MNDLNTKKRLLTISEAADYLSVSKVTIRRWTNAGRLACVRLGPRGERRFEVSALEAAMSPVDSTLLQTQSIHSPKKESSDHRCFISDNPSEEWDMLGPEVLAALNSETQVFIVEDPTRRELLKQRLHKSGFNLAELESLGMIRCVSIADSYLLNGEMQYQRAIAYFESVILAAKARGVDDLLIIGNSSWIAEHRHDDALLRELSLYEQGMDEVIKRYPGVSILCPYDANHVGSHVFVEVLACHEAIGVRSAAS